MRNAHSEDGTQLMQPRWAFSLLRGPIRKMAREVTAKRATSAATDASSSPKLVTGVPQ